MAGLIMGTFSYRHVPVLFLKSQFQSFLHFSSFVSLYHFVIRDDSFEIDFTSDRISGGHHVVEVDIFDKRFHVGLLLDLLFAHFLGDLAGTSFETSYEGMGELSVFGAFFALFHDHCLLTSLSTVQEDTHSTVFEELYH
jgi:hypothetical protein